MIIRPIQAGFTLVELLIVVIIIAVLAAIVVPQFTSATIDAQEAALDANLAAMRSAIELYRAQHNNVYPGANVSNGGTCTVGVPGTGATGGAGGQQAFMDQLLQYSNATGQTCTGADSNFKYGPYFRKGIPADSITGKGAVAAEITVTAAGTPLAPAAATGGWAYDTKSGQIVMNSNALDSKKTTIKYSDH